MEGRREGKKWRRRVQEWGKEGKGKGRRKGNKGGSTAWLTEKSYGFLSLVVWVFVVVCF